jgi:DNA-binding FadR family transcriptional regulator
MVTTRFIDTLAGEDIAIAQGSRVERIARHLANRIAQDELEPGTKLPTESALAQHFSVSRAAIREAMAMLKAEGLIQTMQGSGAFVAQAGSFISSRLDKLTHASLASLLDLIEVRRVIEGEIAARAATVGGPEALDRINAAFARLQLAEAEGRPGVAEDRAFHASIADASGNVYWQTLTESLAKSIEIAISVTRVNEAMREGFSVAVGREHAAIRNAIVARDADAARAAAAHHMEQSAIRVMSADHRFWQAEGAPVRNLPGT